MTTITIRGALRAAVTGVAVLAPIVLATTPATAATLALSNAYCESLGTHAGHTGMLCGVDITGGTAPYAKAWSGVANAGFSGTGITTGRGECNARTTATVKITVTDASHVTKSLTTSFYCNPIAQ